MNCLVQPDFGNLVCLQCSSIHKSLFAAPRSIGMDEWTSEQIAPVLAMGNIKSAGASIIVFSFKSQNKTKIAIYEARLTSEQRPDADAPLDARIAFATAKCDVLCASFVDVACLCRC